MTMSGFKHCLDEWMAFSDIVILNPDLCCSLKSPGAL